MSSLGIFLSAKAVRIIPTKFLTKILSPIKDELSLKQLWIDETDIKAQFNADLISKHLRNNADKIPQDILDAFFYIDALIKGKMKDRVFVELSELNEAELEDDAYIISKLWTIDCNVAKKLYSQVRIKAQRSFTFLKPSIALSENLKILKENQISSLETNLSTWFKNNNKGTKAKIFQHDKKHKIIYHIQHGSTLKREAIIDGDESGIAIIRKEIEDILVFDKATGEIGIYTSEKANRLVKYYLSLFGLTFFNIEICYVPQSKFSLNTILQKDFAINYGNLRDRIAYFDIESFKVEIGYKSENELTVKSKSDTLNLFKDLVSTQSDIIVKNIKFKILFSGDYKLKSFTIYSDQHSSYPPNCEHSLIDEILTLNGICINRKVVNATKANQALELSA